MRKLNEQLGEFANKLCHATSFDESFSAFDQQVKNFGFGSALYSFIPRVALDNHLPRTPIFSLSDSYDQNYMKHYAEARFDKNDYVIKTIEDGSMACLDWWEDVERGILTPEKEAVLAVGRNDYQIKNGLTIPTLTGVSGIAAASFISEDSDQLFRKLKAER